MPLQNLQLDRSTTQPEETCTTVRLAHQRQESNLCLCLEFLRRTYHSRWEDNTKICVFESAVYAMRSRQACPLRAQRKLNNNNNNNNNNLQAFQLIVFARDLLGVPKP